MVLDTKVCKGCGQELPLAAYYGKAQMSDGRDSLCKPCRNQGQSLNHTLNAAITRARKSADYEPVDLDQLWVDQGGRCALCGGEMARDAVNQEGRINVDHNLPVSRGGRWTRENLSLMHRMCNVMKGTLTIDEWVTWAEHVVEYQREHQ